MTQPRQWHPSVSQDFKTAYARFAQMNTLEAAREGRESLPTSNTRTAGYNAPAEASPDGFGTEYERDIAMRRKFMGVRDAMTRKGSPEEIAAVLRHSNMRLKADAAGTTNNKYVQKALLLAREAASRKFSGSRANRAAAFNQEDVPSQQITANVGPQAAGPTGPSYRRGGQTGLARSNAVDIISDFQKRAAQDEQDQGLIGGLAGSSAMDLTRDFQKRAAQDEQDQGLRGGVA